MRLEYADYIKLVTVAYNKKRTNNEISPLLIQSTPANVRRECANVYQERYEKKDEQVLRAFFGPGQHGRQFLQNIQEFDTDRFRPLDNYIKGNTEKTDDRNIELLAWLIDFRHRPYAFGKDVILNEEELFIIGKSGDRVAENQPDPNPEQKSTTAKIEVAVPLHADSIENNGNGKSKKTITILLTVTICFAAIFILLQQKNTNTGCMYWAGDHYEAIPCNKEQKGFLKFPMDAEKMKNFKRILNVDTITERSIQKVHYLKIDGRIEYYTTGGNHPVEVTRTLKPLSRYMFENHLLKPETVLKDSLAD